MAEELDKRILDLISHREITDLSFTYARAQDRLEPTKHRSVFHDDAYLDYGYFKGGPDEFVAFAQGVLRDMAVTQHLVGQIDIEIVGDEAFGEVYNFCYHRVEHNGEPHDLIISGRYVDRYERRDGTWKIAFRSELVDWARIEPAADDLPGDIMSSALWTRRGNVDISDRRQDMRHPQS